MMYSLEFLNGFTVVSNVLHSLKRNEKRAKFPSKDFKRPVLFRNHKNQLLSCFPICDAQESLAMHQFTRDALCYTPFLSRTPEA